MATKKQLRVQPNMNILLKISVALSLLISLLACTKPEPSDQEKIETIVIRNLIDPESVRFGKYVVSADGNRACIEYNSKNRLGGYAGQSVAEFNKQNGTWAALNLDANTFSCTQIGFKISDTKDAAELEAVEVMAAALQRSRNLSETDAKKLAGGESIVVDGKNIDCSDARSNFIVSMRSVGVEGLINKDSAQGKYDKYIAEIISNYFNKGHCLIQNELDNILDKLDEILESKSEGEYKENAAQQAIQMVTEAKDAMRGKNIYGASD